MSSHSQLINSFLSINSYSPTIISTNHSHSDSKINHNTNPNPNSSRSTTTRASVAIIIRINPSHPHHHHQQQQQQQQEQEQEQETEESLSDDSNLFNRLCHFLSQPLTRSGALEVFFIERTKNRSTDTRWVTAHLAFPGGRMEPDDEDGLFCAMRETWEEVGIDLAERHFIQLGRLDDREITTSLGKRLLMVLSPYVFLYTKSDGGPTIPTLEPSQVNSAYWIPLNSLTGPQTRWGEISIDLSSRLAPSRGRFIRFILSSLVGSMRFRSIIIPYDPILQTAQSDLIHHHNPEKPAVHSDLNLWGLTLGMTLDLLAFFKTEEIPIFDDHLPQVFRSPSLDHLNTLPREITLVAPSITSIFPRFTHPDINALIWLLGRRYRNLIKQYQDQQEQIWMSGVTETNGRLTTSAWRRSGGTPTGAKHPMTMNYLNKRISWTSLTMKEFYRSVRKALILSVLFRITSFSLSLALLASIFGPKALAKSHGLLRWLIKTKNQLNQYRRRLFS